MNKEEELKYYEHKIEQYIYFDENNNVDYSTHHPDKYNNNQYCIRLEFETQRDRDIILDALFPKEKNNE